MSTFLGPSGPNPVKDGLIMYLDAANPSSYSGSGAIWYNLVNSSINSDLENNPLYVSGGQANISLDGLDDRIISTGLTNTLTSVEKEGGLTYEYWVKPEATITTGLTQTTTSSNFYRLGNEIPQGLGGDISYNYSTPSSIYVGFGFAFGTNGFLLGVHKNSYAPVILVDYRNFSGINHLVVIKNQNTCSYYVNGVFMKTSLIIGNGATTIGDGFNFITQKTNAFTKYFKGSIYAVRLYKKALTLDEIIRNYNCERYRYL